MSGGSGKLRPLGFLSALALLAGTAAAEPRLRHDVTLRWTESQSWFGGFSAIEVGDKGTDATLLSDRAHILTVRLKRTDGRLSGVTVISHRPLVDAEGRALVGAAGDAEGLAIDARGRRTISFEMRHRVARYLGDGQTAPLPGHPDFASLRPNGGFEALAVHPDGTLYALPERPPAGEGIPVYAFRRGTWRVAATLPRRGPFLPTGADVDAQGQLYLLERATTPLGFRSRIRRFDLATGSEDILMTSLPGRFDNLEGLSVWTDAAGTVRVTTVSDDNFLPIQQTQLGEFVLEE